MQGSITLRDDLERPWLKSGRCTCGAPIALEMHFPSIYTRTFHHDEVPLFSTQQYMLLVNDRLFNEGRLVVEDEAFLRLLSEALTNSHSWMVTRVN